MGNIIEDIRTRLFEQQDTGYRNFQAKLIPTAAPGSIIGVRTPELKKLAAEYSGKEDIGEFLKKLPHYYFEENQLHAFLINIVKDYDRCMELLKAFLPYIDNWATCDQLSPKIFRKHRQELLEEVKVWIKSSEIYTIRFAVGMLMGHFLDEDFKEEYLELAAGVRSDEYYVNMMTAWYFATALAKQYDSAVKYIEDERLDVWTHDKSIQKSIESRRVSAEHKEYLRKLIIKAK